MLICSVMILKFSFGSSIQRLSDWLSDKKIEIDDVIIVQYIVWVVSNQSHEDPLFDGCPSMFRLWWNTLCKHLHLPFKSQDGGVTPGALRGSGAAFHYRRCEDIPRLAWRGRWFRPQTLEHY
eukprot:TRINITY_DN91975_c0_g1_i1.p2 TRINITY_DN91975_c0_g1~~TRINITY_DN91975_c0_g1_i1.p2  ORF type:complete len:122 (+),score=12.47 TRINITY_DN91975_c0_g1_i1:82-447(+)